MPRTQPARGLTWVALTRTIPRMRRLTPVFLMLILALGCRDAAPGKLALAVAVDLAASKLGEVPDGFSTALTGGGSPVAWAVREDASAPHGRSLVQESKDDTSYRFPLCIYDKLDATDVSASVRFKTISGTVDQAAGLVLRYQPENYYVARANALEDNINLFKTVKGNRLKITEVPVKVTPAEWHELGFKAVGSHLIVTFDGKNVIEVDDTTFPGAGKVGLWTKADSVTAFADLRIEPTR